jgi:hypothetical protein
MRRVLYFHEHIFRLPRQSGCAGVLLLISLCSVSAPAEGRTIAVLEFRAGVKSAQEIASGMAEEISNLTSNKVINPSEARLRLGSNLDAEVARCKGDSECISKIGQTLECDEVILVGVSQLGDLILAIQRIEVSSGHVLARLADSLQPRSRIKSNNLRSYLHRLLPSEDFKRYGQISVQTGVTGDEVFLDEGFKGKTPLSPLKVPAPGRYSLRVSRGGYEDFEARLDVLPEAMVEVTPNLGRKSMAPKWYQQWWVWALVGGAVVAGTTAAVVGSRAKNPDTVPAVIRFNP